MNKSIRKMVGGLLTVFILAGGLLGCGTSSETSKADTTQTNISTLASTEVKKLEEVTLRFIFVGDKPKDSEAVWENVSELSKDAINARFEITHIPWGDYIEKIKLMAASGDNYDMSFDANWFAFPTLAKNGALLELDSLMDQYAPNFKKYLVDTGNLDWAKVNGKTLAIPYSCPTTQRGMVAVREDLVKKYNLTAKFSTIEDIDAYLQALDKVDKKSALVGGYGKGTNILDGLGSIMMTKYSLDREFGQSNFGIVYDLNDSQLTLVSHEQTAAFKEAAQYARKWYQNGWISKNAINEDETGKKVQDGAKAFSIRGTIDCFAPTTVPNIEVKPYELYPDNKVALSGSMGNALVFNKNAANPERAMMFIEWVMANQENYDSVMYGIKDKTYVVKQEDGKDVIDYMPGQDSQTSYLAWNGRWAFWTDMWRRPSPDVSLKYLKEGKPMDSNPNNIKSPVAGFTFDPEPVKGECAKRQALMDEYGKALMFGIISDTDKSINDYIQKQKDIGTDKIVAEMQKQLNDFIASKNK